MWIISEFLAYAMLFGWTTLGRLSYLYYLGMTDPFQLKYGRKTCWFHCHRLSSP